MTILADWVDSTSNTGLSASVSFEDRYGTCVNSPLARYASLFAQRKQRFVSISREKVKANTDSAKIED